MARNRIKSSKKEHYNLRIGSQDINRISILIWITVVLTGKSRNRIKDEGKEVLNPDIVLLAL